MKEYSMSHQTLKSTTSRKLKTYQQLLKMLKFVFIMCGTTGYRLTTRALSTILDCF